MRLSRPMATWAIASIHSRGVSPRLMPRSNRSTSAGISVEQRIERLVEQFEPGDLGVVQIDDDAGALGLIDPRLAQRVLEALRRLLLARPRLVGDLTFTTPHG